MSIAAPSPQRARIRDVALINASSIKGSGVPTYIEYIDISSVGSGEFTEPPKPLLFTEAPSRARRIVRAGDTILSTVRPNRRSFLFIAAPSPQAVASTGFAVLSPTSKVDARYLYYWVTRQDFTDYLTLHAKGAAYPAVSADDIGAGEIDLPPLPVQRRIAGILSAYDELIENSQRRIRTLEAMARALYREWFVYFRFPGHENHPRVASPLGVIPEGWEGQFGDLATIEREGINPFEFPEEEFEHFSIPAFDNGRQPAIELGATILSGKYCIDESTVLLSKLNPRIPRIWLPAPSGQRRAIRSTEFLGLKPQPGMTRELIYAKCCSDEFSGQFVSLAIGTSTSHQRVRPESLLAMPSTVPDRETTARFSILVSPILTMCQQLRSQIQTLRHTRDLLLPRLLSGQVELEAA